MSNIDLKYVHTNFGHMSAQEVLYNLIDACGKEAILNSLTDYQKEHLVQIISGCPITSYYLR